MCNIVQRCRATQPGELLQEDRLEIDEMETSR